MIRKHTLALGLSACFILSGCNDKIEEANKASAKTAAQTPAAITEPAMQQPAQAMAQDQHALSPIKGAITITDLYAKKKDLNGQAVVIQGKVVKVSDGIMGKSWVHIKDGTGGKDTNEVVFTSATQSATVGDQITAKGTLSVDKDFGYGYFYSVIVEEAVFSK